MTHRIIFFGSSDFGLPSLDALHLLPGARLVAVVSQAPKPAGRQAVLQNTPVASWAKEHDVSLLTPRSLRSVPALTELKKINADTYIVAAYGLILPQAVLDIPAYGCLNIHGSLLPKYRGASPIAAALLNGDPGTGISFMKMDAGIDTGPVLQQYSLAIEPEETRPQLETRLAELAASHLPELLRQWWQELIQPQLQTGQSSYAPVLQTENGRATWDSAEALTRKIRAYQPWPGVWTNWQGQRLKILSAIARNVRHEAAPGSIVSSPGDPGWAIVCQDGLLIPRQVQLAGKKPVSATIMPGSYPHFIGSRCQ